MVIVGEARASPFFPDRFSLSSPKWPATHYAAQASFKFMETHLSLPTYGVLGLKGTVPGPFFPPIFSSVHYIPLLGSNV